MKAIILSKYGSKDVLILKDIAKPSPKDDEVQIKVHAASVNDWDWALMRGKPFVIRPLTGLTKPKINIPGVDVAGKVVAVGKNVTKFQPGDDVYGDLSEHGFGAFAEYVCTSEKALIKKSPLMTFKEAAALPHAAMLVIQGLIEKGQIQSGMKVLINGAGGGVGTLGIQLAKAYNIDITGVDSADKLDMLKSLGYDHVIDYKQTDFTIDKNCYDLILDTKTNRPIHRYVSSLKKNGKYITVGGALPRILTIVLMAPLVALFKKKAIEVLSLKPNKNLDYVNELFKAGKLKPVIDGPYSLNEIPEIMQYFGKGKHKGKIVVTIAKE